MDIRLLKQFVAVYEEQNISHAAERSFVSQPALSNAIRQLEEELGCLLFNRSKRGVIPTTEAEQLYPVALQMVEKLDSIPKLFMEKKHRESVSIAVMPELPYRAMGRVLSQIQEVIEENTLQLSKLEEPCDAKLVLDFMKSDDELFLPLFRENYVFCLHQDHPLAQNPEVKLEDLNHQPFIICPPCEAHHRTLGMLARKNLSVNIVARAESKQQVAMLLLANCGVSFLPEEMAREWSELVIRPFSEGVVDHRTVGLAWSSKGPPAPLLNRVIEHFQKQVTP